VNSLFEIMLWHYKTRVRSLTPKILRPTWGNKAENIKAEKGGAEKKDQKKNGKKKKKIFSNLTLTQIGCRRYSLNFFFCNRSCRR
jgi:hypothetical protein